MTQGQQVTPIQQPNPEALFGELAASDFAAGTLSIVLASRKSKSAPLQYERLQLTQNLSSYFKEKFLKRYVDAKAASKDNGDLELHAYDRNAGSHQHEIQYLETRNFPEILDQLAPVENLPNLPVFSEDKSFMRGIKHYIAVLQFSSGKKVQFFRQYVPTAEMTKSSLFHVFMANGQYDILNQKTLKFDYYIDCFIYDGVVFIIDDRKFLSIFNLFETLVADARTVLEQVKLHVPIQGFDKFSESCLKDTRKCAKLKSVMDRNYLAGISFEKIKETIQSHHIQVQIGVDANGQECLIYDPLKKWTILKLLHDDYVVSQITGNHYEALAKRAS